MSNKQAIENVVARVLGERETKLTRLDIKSPTVEPIKNFKSVYDKAVEIDRRSNDFEVYAGDLSVTKFTDSNAQSLALVDNKGQYAWEFSGWSLGQFCEKTGMNNTAYVKKCIQANKLDLARMNLQSWLDDVPKHKEFMVRATDNRMHGFLTPKYTAYDDNEVLDVIHDLLGSQFNWKVERYGIDPERFNARLIQNELMPIRGEDLSVGFNVKNSRVGRDSITIQVLIYKWICGNGVIFGGGKGTLYTRKHVGVSREDLVTGFAEMIDNVPTVIEYIKNSVEKAKDIRLNSESMQKLIDQFKEELSVTDQTTDIIQDAMVKYGGQTLWAFINGVTEIAQNYSMDRQEELEAFAGRLLRRAV